MSVKDIAGLANTGMALSIASSSFPKKKRKGKITDTLKTGTNIIVGSSLLRVSSASVAGL